MARKMTLPKMVKAKVGQTLKPEKVYIVSMNNKDQMMVQYKSVRGMKKQLFPWNPYKKRMSVGSGADPIYIY